jgi:hypothetical protein
VSVADAALRSVLKSQYHAALAMLRETIERCPADLWSSTEPKNAFWQVAFHALFFTHLYLQRNEAEFQRWTHQHGGDDGTKGDAYTQAQVLEYWAFCDAMTDRAIDALDLASQESGFSWYRVGKLEHQLINIRHVQHHAAQLADRLRSATDVGTRWVSAGPKA